MVKLKAEEIRQAKAEKEAKKKAEERRAPAKVAVKKGEGKGEGKIRIAETEESFNVVYYPLVTEKAVNMIESENKLTFIVSDHAGKKQIKEVIEKAYSVKVRGVNVVRDRKGRKKAIVRLAPEFKAQELATKLGVL